MGRTSWWGVGGGEGGGGEGEEGEEGEGEVEETSSLGGRDIYGWAVVPGQTPLLKATAGTEHWRRREAATAVSCHRALGKPPSRWENTGTLEHWTGPGAGLTLGSLTSLNT